MEGQNQKDCKKIVNEGMDLFRRGKWPALVNTVVNLYVPRKA
jgi:hypothetical protein